MRKLILVICLSVVFCGMGWGCALYAKSAAIELGAHETGEPQSGQNSFSFPPYSPRNGLKWMCFPIMTENKGNDGKPYKVHALLDSIMFPGILESISWKYLNQYPQSIYFLNSIWVGDIAHAVMPQQGYKIKMNQSLQNQISVSIPGIVPQVREYPLLVKAHLAANPKIDNENWLGYFHTETLQAMEAFANIIDNLWSIQTQNWTMVRQQKLPGSPWIIPYPSGQEPTLSHGDMVIVKCFHDAEFTWNTGADNQTPIGKELPSHYIYEEKADYVPFYVELDADDLPSEVALYVDDVCKGAAVVCDSLVEIPGYILDGTDPNAQVEILAYYDNKAAVNKIPAYQVWNPESGSYDNKPLKLSSKNHYYKLKLDKHGDGTPAISEPALSIYPNPFNPSTTIKFCLTDPADIKLEIYNQNGQLVKCLTQGKADSGFSSINWNGTDSHNRKVASGLYYSRLSFNGKSITKKMILMK